MELHLPSLLGLHVHGCTHWLRPCNSPPSPHIWAYVRARYWSVKTDDICLRPPWSYTQCFSLNTVPGKLLPLPVGLLILTDRDSFENETNYVFFSSPNFMPHALTDPGLQIKYRIK
jgi:hypothetical protein